MVTKKILIVLAAVMLFGVSAANADIVVLNFESLSTPGTGYTHIGPSYTEDGFKLEAVPVGGLYYFNLDDKNFAGSTALFHMAPYGACNAMLTHTGGLTFDLLSIDLSEMLSDQPGYELKLLGTKSDGSTVISSFSLDGVFGFETFTPQGFTDLTALMLDRVGHQYDNITLDVIPEPATILLFGLGSLLLRRLK
jgi:hypothetical protein